MSSATAKIITVFGATGSQGGAVVRALAADGAYKVRAVTRNPESDKAKALPAGVEVVKADFDSPDLLNAALEGAHGVFLVTNYWEILGAVGGDNDKARDKEIAQGKAAVDAAKAQGVKHLVISSLEDVEALTGGALKVPHFDGKGRVAAYAREQGVATTEARYSWYAENWLGMAAPRKNAESGRYEIGLPLGGFPMGVVSVEDAGHAVKAMFDLGEAAVGKAYGLANALEPVSKYAEVLSRVTGKEVAYVDMPADAFRAAMGEDFTNMCLFYHDLEKCVRSIEDTRTLYAGTRTFEAWAEANKAALIAAMP